jgi:predicted PurR-regulated permease PerM
MTSRFRVGVLIVLVALITYLAYRIIAPFFSPLAWASVLAIVGYPIYGFFLRHLKFPMLAALSAVVVVLFIIVGPLSYVFYLLTGELQNLAGSAPSTERIVESYRQSALRPIADRILLSFNMSEKQAIAHLTTGLTNFAKEALTRIPVGLGNLAEAVANFFVMVFVLFFFFRDGHRLVAALVDYLPFSEPGKQRVSVQVKDVVVSTIYGGLAVAIAQGFVGLIAFVTVGLDSPITWAVTTAITSFIPLVGSHVVWVPISVYLLFTGETFRSLLLAAFGIFGIGLVDNIVRPLFIKGRVRMSFLLTFLSVFGGLQAFGLLGIVVGPLVMALFLSIIPMVRDLER